MVLLCYVCKVLGDPMPGLQSSRWSYTSFEKFMVVNKVRGSPKLGQQRSLWFLARSVKSIVVLCLTAYMYIGSVYFVMSHVCLTRSRRNTRITFDFSKYDCPHSLDVCPSSYRHLHSSIGRVNARR